jgi:hypothetical protein
MLALPLPAAATETMICAAGDEASAAILLGAMDVIAVVKADIEIGDQHWSTSEGSGTRITVGQAFETSDQVLIDFTDANVNAIVAQLRLFKTAEGDRLATAGTLRIAGAGAYAVVCEGP